jgi:hypothetical protein
MVTRRTLSAKKRKTVSLTESVLIPLQRTKDAFLLFFPPTFLFLSIISEKLCIAESKN